MSDSRCDELFELDVERFWRDDAASHGKPFSVEKPQVPLGISMTATCVWDELGLPMPPWAGAEVQDPYLVDRDLRRRYNEKALRIIGRRAFPEDDPPPADSLFPPVKSITELFGATTRVAGGTEWVMPAAETPKALEALLDRLESRDLRADLFPENWERERRRIFERYGVKPRMGGGIRGPVTAAMSICGPENLIYLILDAPELAARFRDALAETILEMTRLLYEESETPDRRGFGFNDDNCALLSPDLYAVFGLPILKRVFEALAPEPGDFRFQHSDSAMGHLMPLLREAGLNGANFGPTIPAADIRRALPRCVIYGQLAPWTFARGTDEEIAGEVRRDIEAVGGDGGLVVTTSGSINPGSRLSGLRAIMATIQRFGRYQPM